ncbi:response regulator transcription factor [Flavisolibacter tropicus]|uniref:LuxR family transcriptional regulator n=1 Tax=Flavisolibacter tropicus TaxID=1492898 RepID=A0A172TZ43_9BACT|nr:response regulator transcription factor [Flavisolibacter tropicus]ANE52252.1 LuxR family transcriptional regulator [Flavisolibacter tropicus]
MTPTQNPIRILLADDHEIFRDGFRVMLKKQKEFQLIAEAGNGKELIETALQCQPDVIVTDIKMPEMDGIEATKKLQAILPQTNVIALSMFEDEHLIVDMLEAGAKGYLLKNANKEEVFEALKTVADNGTYYCNHTTQKLAQLIANSDYKPEKKSEKIVFTERELDVIKLICQQYVSKEIADKLGLSPRTVESHRVKIMEKMDVKNTAGIVIYAIRDGIFTI